MGAALVDGLDSSGRKDKSNSFLELRHVNALFLKIGVFANKPGRVKLSGAGAVRVTASYLRPFFIYGTSPHVAQHDIMN